MSTSTILVWVFAINVCAIKGTQHSLVFGTPVEFVYNFIEDMDTDHIVIFIKEPIERKSNLHQFISGLYKAGKTVSVLDVTEEIIIEHPGSSFLLYLILHSGGGGIRTAGGSATTLHCI